jgi:tetratricopeptide (TPR) repeat protein
MCANSAEAHGGDLSETPHANILSAALQHHQAGRLQQAAEGYEAILQQDPQHSDALYFLGIIAQQMGSYETGIQLISAAISRNPSAAHYHHSLGNLYLKLNRTAEAKASFCRAARLDPKYRDSLYAALSAEFERFKEENSAEKCLALGNIKFKDGLFEQAEMLYRRALELRPDHAECYRNLGQTFLRQDRLQEAVESFQKAVALNPHDAAAYGDLGITHQQLKNFAAAEDALLQSSKLNPGAPQTHYNLGNLLRQQFRLAEAIACYHRALECISRNSKNNLDTQTITTVQMQTMNNLALTLDEIGRTEEAIERYREALILTPENADLHYGLATALLISGNFSEGWREHEWRWHIPGFSTKVRSFNCSVWQGEPLRGQKILLHAEQGYGDTLQFVRYAPLVAERGGEVILEVPRCLSQLLGQVPGVKQVIVQGDALPEFSWQCPLMSLPLAFATRLETIPVFSRYISIPEETVRSAKSKWTAEGLRVGLAWSGNPKHFRDAYRSTHLQQLIPLSTVPGVSFYSLQVGEATRQIAELSSIFPIIDVCSKYSDFIDTATFLVGLDLVITVDTAIAHLAGALGIPVWILLPHSRTDWRWLKNRIDSPWYPSARLFHQPAPGDWNALAEHVSQELRKMIKLQPTTTNAKHTDGANY